MEKDRYNVRVADVEWSLKKKRLRKSEIRPIQNWWVIKHFVYEHDELTRHLAPLANCNTICRDSREKCEIYHKWYTHYVVVLDHFT